MSAGLRHAPTFRHVRYRFAWRGISLEYLFAGLAASVCTAFLQWFVGRCGFPYAISWRWITALGAGVMAAVVVLQWRRDPEYLGRKDSALKVPQRLSPWLVDAKDSCLPLREADFL